MNKKYILILGAKSDIGRAITYEYAKIGYNIYLASRDSHQLEDDVHDLQIRYQIQVKAIEFDALAYKQHPQFYASLSPKPYGVVCVAGYLGNQELAQKDFAEAEKIMDTNYKGCVSILNIAADDLSQRKEGFIIGISSVAGDRGRESNYLYGSSKAAFTAYLSGLRNHLHKYGVHVLTVKPGFVYTKMTSHLELPPFLTVKPEKVAKDIVKSQIKKKNVLYTKWYWKYIMLFIRNIPEFIFKRMNM